LFSIMTLCSLWKQVWTFLYPCAIQATSCLGVCFNFPFLAPSGLLQLKIHVFLCIRQFSSITYLILSLSVSLVHISSLLDEYWTSNPLLQIVNFSFIYLLFSFTFCIFSSHSGRFPLFFFSHVQCIFQGNNWISYFNNSTLIIRCSSSLIICLVFVCLFIHSLLYFVLLFCFAFSLLTQGFAM
jgi:hypothetical protein